MEPVTDSRNFKLKKQLDLTIVLTKELDSTTEEVEFWHKKYEEAMKIVQKLKCCPQDLEAISEEETEEFTPASQPHTMATHAPAVHVIPNNDDD
jgi:hypothetical protein